MSINTKQQLRIAVVYNGVVHNDRTFAGAASETIRIGAAETNDFITPLVNITEGFELLRHKGKQNYTLKFTSTQKGKIHVGGATQSLVDLAATDLVTGTSTISVQNTEGTTVDAMVFETVIKPGDWGSLFFGDVELVFHFVNPRKAILTTAAIGGSHVIVNSIVAGLFSVLGVGLLMSFLMQGSLLFWAFWTDTSEDDYMSINYDELFAEAEGDVDEQEEEEEEEEEPDIEDAGKAAEDEEGKFGEEEPEDPDTVLPDLDAKLVEKLDKPVGIQAAMSSNLLGVGGAESLFGGGETFGDAMDQVAMNGEGDAFNAGFGYGGMGNMGRGAGGGGSGAGRIGGMANRDTGGGRGSGKGLGKRRKVKVKPKVKFEAPKQEGFCKKENIQKVVKKKASALRNCYERQLLADPALSGKVVMQWKVMMDGAVKSERVKTTTMKNAKVEKCMGRVIKRMKFDKPDGGICVIEFPFAFSPSS